MSTARINSEDRLAGDAKLIGVFRTIEPYTFAFTAWSKNNKCAVADIIPDTEGKHIYGVLYDIPDYLITRSTAKEKRRKSLDEIEGEGEGNNYCRDKIKIINTDNVENIAMTYFVRNRRDSIKTNISYITHIVNGLKEHNISKDYCQYVKSQILLNNSNLRDEISI